VIKDLKPITGFENYLIDCSGKVFSLKSNKYLKPGDNGRGYFKVNLWRNGRQYTITIHRLVAQAFLPNPDNKSFINHKDGNKLNNTVSNLEWVTPAENNQHAYDIGLRKWSPNSGRKLIPINVYDYKTGEFKSTHDSISEAIELYDLNYGGVWRMLHGKSKHTKKLTLAKI